MSEIKEFYNQRWEPLKWYVVSSDTLVLINDGCFVDTSLGPVTIYLPTTAKIGDRVGISDVRGMFSTNRCTINGNGYNVMGYDSYYCGFDNTTIILVYADVIQGWRIVNISENIPVTKKNHMINGDFDVWQRGTTQTTSGYGSDDMWYNHHIGSTKTHTRQSFYAGQTAVSNNPRYYSRTVVTAGAGSGDCVNKYGLIEGVRTIADDVVTLSFWARANDNTKSIAISFEQDFGYTGSAPLKGISPSKFSITNSWKRYSVTAYIPPLTGKTLGTDPNDTYSTGLSNTGFLAFAIWFDAGSSWNASTNTLGHQSGTFDIAQVQLERGYAATKFEYIRSDETLRLCQRYFEILTGVVVPHDETATQRDFYFSVWKRTAPVISNIEFNGGEGATFLNGSGFRRIFQNAPHDMPSEFSLWADSSTGIYYI